MQQAEPYTRAHKLLNSGFLAQMVNNKVPSPPNKDTLAALTTLLGMHHTQSWDRFREAVFQKYQNSSQKIIFSPLCHNIYNSWYSITLKKPDRPDLSKIERVLSAVTDHYKISEHPQVPGHYDLEGREISIANIVPQIYSNGLKSLCRSWLALAHSKKGHIQPLEYFLDNYHLPQNGQVVANWMLAVSYLNKKGFFLSRKLVDLVANNGKLRYVFLELDKTKELRTRIAINFLERGFLSTPRALVYIFNLLDMGTAAYGMCLLCDLPKSIVEAKPVLRISLESLASVLESFQGPLDKFVEKVNFLSRHGDVRTRKMLVLAIFRKARWSQIKTTCFDWLLASFTDVKPNHFRDRCLVEVLSTRYWKKDPRGGLLVRKISASFSVVENFLETVRHLFRRGRLSRMYLTTALALLKIDHGQDLDFKLGLLKTALSYHIYHYQEKDIQDLQHIIYRLKGLPIYSDQWRQIITCISPTHSTIYLTVIRSIRYDMIESLKDVLLWPSLKTGNFELFVRISTFLEADSLNRKRWFEAAIKMDRVDFFTFLIVRTNHYFSVKRIYHWRKIARGSPGVEEFLNSSFFGRSQNYQQAIARLRSQIESEYWKNY